MSHLP